MTHAAPDDRRPGLKPPRFRLSTLMAGISLLAVFFASVNYVGSHMTALMTFFGLVILAHVLANALGTRLRENGDRPIDAEGQLLASTPPRRLHQPHFAPATQLRQKSTLGPGILIATGVGVLLGGFLGGLALTMLSKEPATLVAITLGALAASVLGGIWTFMAASFLQVAAGAAWQAMRDRH